jgi:hypothetical protein
MHSHFRKGNSSKMSNDDLTWAVDACAAQIALTWMVHQWEPAAPNKPLDLQIADFSARALREMGKAYPALRNANEEIRWLTYFKGLIASDTHPRDQMLNAIEAVRRRRADPGAKLLASAVEPEDAETPEIEPSSLADALAAIDRALSSVKRRL